jgi:hypothetical protein
MSVLIGRGRLVVAGLAAVGVLMVMAASASAETVYSNVPGTLEGNYASVGAEAYGYGEFGTQVELAGAARNGPQIEVVMSAWACQFGAWFAGTCETPSKKKFKWPMTVKLYEVGEKNQVGEKLGEATKTFSMPYRPSEDHVHCESGRWYDATTATCFHGLAFKVKFPRVKVKRLPKRVVVGISYNTSDFGPTPVGKTACNEKSGGCYYDSLNVGLAEPAENLLTAGANPAGPYINVLNAGYDSETCGNEAEVGKFIPAECEGYWEGDEPLIQISAN